jgi:hypothetical protein
MHLTFLYKIPFIIFKTEFVIYKVKVIKQKTKRNRFVSMQMIPKIIKE